MTGTGTDGDLTREQLIAAGTPQRRLRIEGAPGSGKTTVAAQRFGIQRFRSGNDQRAVIAVSLTRSATAELRGRVLSHRGPAALARPHRIVTLDTLVCDRLTHLLHTGHMHWPAGHRSLTMIDHWQVLLWTPTGSDGNPFPPSTATRSSPSCAGPAASPGPPRQPSTKL
ncbi:UvrD-helicase domain-containing protein [Streptomyces macrosporus]|uniref:UvrD-like helicase ATP-binding domain-containing protein n=1 Tax=Streptomyces macrosporus TaxID=44032 RepID=A0ABP5XGV8_9ACTN